MDAPDIPRATPTGRTAFLLPHQVHVAGTLHIEILECERIKKSLLGARVYPYVRLSLANQPTLKTKVSRDKIPKWNERFDVKVTEEMDPALRLDIVNGSKDKHKLLGSVICFFAKMVLEKRSIDTWFPLKPENSEKLVTRLHCKVSFTTDARFAAKLASLGPNFLENLEDPRIAGQLGTYSRLWEAPAEHPLNQLAGTDVTLTAPPGGLVDPADEDPTATDETTEADVSQRTVGRAGSAGGRHIAVALGDEPPINLRLPAPKPPGPGFPMPPAPTAPGPFQPPPAPGPPPTFEFKWEEGGEVFGPHTCEEMVDWHEGGYFTTNVAHVRQLSGQRLWDGFRPSSQVDFGALAAAIGRRR